MAVSVMSLCSLRKWINYAVKSTSLNQIIVVCVPAWLRKEDLKRNREISENNRKHRTVNWQCIEIMCMT